MCVCSQPTLYLFMQKKVDYVRIDGACNDAHRKTAVDKFQVGSSACALAWLEASHMKCTLV